jgi:hypothetical protein
VAQRGRSMARKSKPHEADVSYLYHSRLSGYSPAAAVSYLPLGVF